MSRVTKTSFALRWETIDKIGTGNLPGSISTSPGICTSATPKILPNSISNSLGWGFSLLCLIGIILGVAWYVHRKRSRKVRKRLLGEIQELKELHVDSDKDSKRAICACRTSTCTCRISRESVAPPPAAAAGCSKTAPGRERFP